MAGGSGRLSGSRRARAMDGNVETLARSASAAAQGPSGVAAGVARARRAPPMVLAAGLGLGLVGVVLTTLAGFAAGAGYPWELASHFRPHLVAAAAALTTAALITRRGALASTAALIALINAAQIAHALSGRAPAPAAGAATVTLVWANVAMSPDAFAAAAALARDVDADIVALTEVPRDAAPVAAAALNAQCLDIPGPTSRLRVMLATRAPCAPQSRPIAAADTAWPHAIRALTPQLPARPKDAAARRAPARVVAVHPPPPLSPGRRAVRDAIIADGAQAAAAADTAVLVGDFNATPWSPARAALRRRGFRGVDCGAPWAATWFTRAPWGLPIDAAYTRGPIEARCRVGPPIGSDHFPLIIEFVVEASPTDHRAVAAAARRPDAPPSQREREPESQPDPESGDAARLRGLERLTRDHPS